MKRRRNPRRSSWILKAARDGAIGLAVYAGIAMMALEDRAQAGHALLAKPQGFFTQSATWGTDSSYFTLTVLGLLFAALTAFSLGAMRHFGQTMVLSRVRRDRAPFWSNSRSSAYWSKR